jgi:hypothetical protein
VWVLLLLLLLLLLPVQERSDGVAYGIAGLKTLQECRPLAPVIAANCQGSNAVASAGWGDLCVWCYSMLGLWALAGEFVAGMVPLQVTSDTQPIGASSNC